MARIGAGMPRLLVALLLQVLSPAATGAALTAEQTSPLMMRRDARTDAPSALQLGPAGEMVEVEASGTSGKEASAVVPEGCDDTFELGSENSDNCGTNHTMIEDDGKCREAAETNHYVMPSNGVISGDFWEKTRPKGCFKFPCSESATGECYFYNEREDPVPARQIVGTPVCLKPKYMNGTAVGNATVTCPAGYAMITDEETCRGAGICQGYCEGSEFRASILAADAADLYPEGCFIHAKEGCVYFNPPKATPPTHPSGTPLCNTTTSLPSSSSRTSPPVTSSNTTTR